MENKAHTIYVDFRCDSRYVAYLMLTISCRMLVMGESKRRRILFFGEHPLCCYCGGNTPIQTIDHMPPRILFDGKLRPDDLTFPSCQKCNSDTSQDEQIVALIARSAYGQSKENYDEVAAIMRGVANNAAGLLEAMRPSLRDKRNFMKKLGLEPGRDGPASEVPIMKIDDTRINKAFSTFARKLACSLHYRHTGLIIPSEGAIAVQWRTSMQVHDNAIPDSFLEMLGAPQTLRQGSFEVANQFTYRHACSPDGLLSAYLASLRNQIAVIGLVHCAPHGEEMFKQNDVDVFNPFPPQVAADKRASQNA